MFSKTLCVSKDDWLAGNTAVSVCHTCNNFLHYFFLLFHFYTPQIFTEEKVFSIHPVWTLTSLYRDGSFFAVECAL